MPRVMTEPDGEILCRPALLTSRLQTNDAAGKALASVRGRLLSAVKTLQPFSPPKVHAGSTGALTA